MRNLLKFVMIALAVSIALIALLVLGFYFSNRSDLRRLEERKAFWQAEMQRGLPERASVEDARSFFVAHGIVLDCRPSETEGGTECWGYEQERYGMLPVQRLYFKLRFADGAMTSREVVAVGGGA